MVAMLKRITDAWRVVRGELRVMDKSNSGALLFDGGLKSVAGASITEESALRFSAVWAACRILGESVASLPLITYRRRKDGGKDRVSDTALSILLHDQPNANQSSYVFRETLQATHLCLWGNGLADINRGATGRIESLTPLHPSRVMELTVEGDILTYHIRREDGSRRMADAKDIFHVPGLSSDGLWGMAPVSAARESIGLALAAETFGSSFFGNGAHPGLILHHPGRLDEPAQINLKKGVTRFRQDKAHGVLVLQEGTTVTPITMPLDDAQYILLRRFQVNEIARIFRVPPHMLGDLERATFSNIEHLSIEFVVHSIRPWLVRWEQEINRKLFGIGSPMFAEFRVDGLLRGDTLSRFQSYSVGIQNGILNRNEVRALENLNPYEGGEEYLVPTNLAQTDADGITPLKNPSPTPKLPKDEGKSRRISESFYLLLMEAVKRLRRKEAKRMTFLVNKCGRTGNARGAILEFWDKHTKDATDVLGSTVEAYSIAMGTSVDVPAVVRQYVAEGRDLCLSCAGDDFGSVLSSWESTGVDDVVRRELERCSTNGRH